MSTRTTLEAYAKAWEDGDLRSIFDAYADDVVFHYFGASDLAGTHVQPRSRRIPARIDSIASGHAGHQERSGGGRSPDRSSALGPVRDRVFGHRAQVEHHHRKDRGYAGKGGASDSPSPGTAGCRRCIQ